MRSGLTGIFLLVTLLLPLYAESRLGRVILQLQDESGAAVPGVSVEVLSNQTDVLLRFRTSSSGEAIFRGLPFGAYQLLIDDERFEPIRQTFLVSTEVPQSLLLQLKVRGPASEITISNSSSIVDPQKSNSSLHRGQNQINERMASLPNRDLIETVASLPGWVLEANGVLHPRGSEYQTQYVFDGIPILDNLSPAFAPGPLLDAVDSLEVMTAGIPAEFGRKLGGVINVSSRAASDQGRGAVQLYGGNQSLLGVGLQFSGNDGNFGYSGGLSASHTTRYLDPPVPENFYNQANLGSGFVRWDYAPGKENVFRLSAWANYTHLQVPNEIFQQAAGQQQSRLNRDQNLSLSWEHYYSSQATSAIGIYTRHLSADLRSNPVSTPVIAQQAREFSAHGIMGSFSKILGRHQLKFGGDAILSPVQELFVVAVTDPGFFEDTTRITNFTPEHPFLFSERRNSLDYSSFIQDQWRLRNLTLNVGLRYDGYRFLIHDYAWSPRFAAAYFIPKTQTNIHFAYDRAFQTPALENLLLTSSTAAQALSPLRAEGREGGVPVPTSRANFYEAGFSQALGWRIRLDAHVFRRELKNSADDDVFFNTGVSFPISMSRSQIKGAEVRLEILGWRGLSGFASYSNLLGFTYTPVTGGLFLGEDIASLLEPDRKFPISQDQRNTLHFQIHFQPKRCRWWIAGGVRYESGLPVELDESTTLEDLQRTRPQAILDQVNFSRKRIMPHRVWDVSAGVRFWTEEKRLATFQVDVLNLTDRFYLINFDSLLSGTAVGLSRTAVAKLAFRF